MAFYLFLLFCHIYCIFFILFCSFPLLFAFVVGGLGFEFCVFVAGWRHALRSEWPFIIIIITVYNGNGDKQQSVTLLNFVWNFVTLLNFVTP